MDNQTEEHVYVNPAYITIIVAGSAGSKEKLSGGSSPKKDLAKFIEDYGLVQSLLTQIWQEGVGKLEAIVKGSVRTRFYKKKASWPPQLQTFRVLHNF